MAHCAHPHLGCWQPIVQMLLRVFLPARHPVPHVFSLFCNAGTWGSCSPWCSSVFGLLLLHRCFAFSPPLALPLLRFSYLSVQCWYVRVMLTLVSLLFLMFTTHPSAFGLPAPHCCITFSYPSTLRVFSPFHLMLYVRLMLTLVRRPFYVLPYSCCSTFTIPACKVVWPRTD